MLQDGVKRRNTAISIEPTTGRKKGRRKEGGEGGKGMDTES